MSSLIRMPMDPWTVLDRTLTRMRGNVPNNRDAAVEMLTNMRDGVALRWDQQVLRELIYVMVQDSSECFGQLVDAFAHLTGIVEDLARVIPTLIEDPKAQIVADMVMAKRYAEAREVIRELEKEPRGYPCAECGTLRTRAEGGTVFTVCDACWDRLHDKTTCV